MHFRYFELRSKGPFFRIIREGPEGFADGEDYFDLLADDVTFVYVISVPGYPRRVKGQRAIIDLYSDYDKYMTVRSADHLRVYRDLAASVVVLEYEVHGESAQTGRRTTITSFRSSRSRMAK